MDVDMDSDINNLSELFMNKTSIIWYPNSNFVKDINIIINELNKYISIVNLDIYEVLVSCGHDLTWDVNYNISLNDLNWFRNDEGKNYFFSNFKITTISEYDAIIDIHFKLCELFELQLE